MQRKLILDTELLNITVDRLCQQLIENHGNFEHTAILGLQPKGVFLAEIIHEKLEAATGTKIDLGYLDTTFYRDDFRRRETPVKANATKVPFIIEDKNVVIIDDVLFTGRSVRAALDAMIAFGRPRKVELLVLVNRKYSRQLPIEPDYIGREVNTMAWQKVLVELKAQGFKNNKIWLINKEEK
ncbi:bifunctional pyr operon transcriptional regulator/uracil phosphoribosyltransferase PyrR [Fulvivirga sp. RKSG066]|uniref:bifunctional pyr operon transcriptional regulator/uracil phosphoribosyltransferase PyrR n=1 Tax=Fulvivirga aurantia TaxID=2529383 RepID=UPI0012BCF528|nr:bifunctional pyr operon transcriptional regulator/uracil phosphoribosyltransferase PyrR [Fulvivirga aurantia]MTI22121.1 bifunctional pyr operon transcriptional regulator/uracil phosphoribosyltransferase PyrR [Fulvivirga aurantia]